MENRSGTFLIIGLLLLLGGIGTCIYALNMPISPALDMSLSYGTSAYASPRSGVVNMHLLHLQALTYQTGLAFTVASAALFSAAAIIKALERATSETHWTIKRQGNAAPSQP